MRSQAFTAPIIFCALGAFIAFPQLSTQDRNPKRPRNGHATGWEFSAFDLHQDMSSAGIRLPKECNRIRLEHKALNTLV